MILLDRTKLTEVKDQPCRHNRAQEYLSHFEIRSLCTEISSEKLDGKSKESSPIYLVNPNSPDDELSIMIENHALLMKRLNGLGNDGKSDDKLLKQLVDLLRAIGVYHWDRSNILESKAAHEDALHHLLTLQSSPSSSFSFFGSSDDNEKDLATLLHFMGSIYSRMAIGNGNLNSVSASAETIPVHVRLQHKKEAMKWFNKSLKMKQKLFGADHAEVGKTLNGIGMLYAPTVFSKRRSIEATTRALSSGTNKSVESIRYDDSKDHEGQFNEDFEQAKMHFQRSIQIFRNTFSNDHPFVASVCENLGRVYMMAGFYGDALKEYSEVLRIKKIYIDMGGLEPNDDSLAALYSVMGDCEFDLNKDLEKALSLYKTALELLKAKDENEINDNKSIVMEEKRALLAVLYHKLGLVHSRMSKLDMALAQFEESVAMKKEIGGNDHFEVAVTLNCMGAIYGTKGDTDKALSFFREALRIFKIHAVTEEGVLDEEDVNVIDAASNIALLEGRSKITN